MKVEVSFQIEEEILSEALIRLQDMLDDIDANAMVEEGEPSKEPELRELLKKLRENDPETRNV